MVRIRELLLAVISTLVAFTLFEVLLRLDPDPVSWYVLPAKIETRLRTDEFDSIIRTNAHGLREPSVYYRTKLPKTYRIAAVGDSFTMGWGVNYEHTYEQALIRALKHRHGLSDVEVINVGQPAAQPPHYYHFVRDYVWWMKPDLVLVGFLLGNDSQVAMGPPERNMPVEQVYDSLRKLWWREPNTVPIDAPDTAFRTTVLPLESSVRLFKPLWEKMKIWWVRDGARRASEGYCELVWTKKDYTFSREQVVKTFGPESLALKKFDELDARGLIEKARRCEIMYYRINGIIATADREVYGPTFGLDQEMLPIMREAWRAAHDFLKDIETTAAGYNAKTIVFGIPIAAMVDPKAIQANNDLGQNNPINSLGARATADALMTDCERLKLSCVDLFGPVYDAIKNYPQTRFYFPIDTHMTNEGNELLGNLMADSIAPLIKSARAGRR